MDGGRGLPYAAFKPHTSLILQRKGSMLFSIASLPQKIIKNHPQNYRSQYRNPIFADRCGAKFGGVFW
jgi:hypothetical protein